MSDSHTRMPIAVTHEGGLRFAAQVRSHRVITDQSERAGGEDSAPSPIELISVALGSCVALYVHQFCLSRGLPHEGMSVEVLPHHAASPSRIAALDVTVRLPVALPPHAMEMLERVVRSCPAHNTLAQGAAVSVSIDTRAAAHAGADERFP
jgi:putative redox protein